MTVIKREGPLPDNHPLAGGKTIILGVGRKFSNRSKKKTKEIPETHERRAMNAAVRRWKLYQQKRLARGLPPSPEEKYLAYMRKEKKRYFASLKEKTETTDQSNETNITSGKNRDIRQPKEIGTSERSHCSKDVKINNTDPKLVALNDLDKTTNILIEALLNYDLDKAHEAISIMLMQGMNYWGPDNPALQQCFPVWDAIKKHIDTSNVIGALGQTKTWQSQLHEVIEIVSTSQD